MQSLDNLHIQDSLELYARLVSAKATRRHLIDNLDPARWDRQPGSPSPKAYGNAIKRHVSFLTNRDEADFEFDGEFLRRVLFESRLSGARSEFDSLWSDFKSDVHRQLKGAKSQTKGRQKSWLDQQCTWTWQGVIVAAQVQQNWKKCSIRMDIHRPAVPESQARSLEDLFVF
jgi:hypothetical protein